MANFPSDIGDFVIGASPIGVDYFQWENTIYSQYANSPVLLQLLDYFFQWIDPTDQINSFYNNVWNVDTAVGWGLDVWGNIVGVSRTIPGSPSKYLGFEESGDLVSDPFNQSPFYSGESLSGNFTLADDSFRLLILAKAAANIWDGSIPGLNTILRTLFPGEVCYVVDNLNMSLTYTFDFTLTAAQLAVVQNSGVLPRPCGVSTSIVQG